MMNDLSVGHVASNLDFLMRIIIERYSHCLFIIIVILLIVSIAKVIRVVFSIIVVEDIIIVILNFLKGGVEMMFILPAHTVLILNRLVYLR